MTELTKNEKQFLAELYYGDDDYLELDWEKLKSGDKTYCGILGSLCRKNVLIEEEHYCFIVNDEYKHMIDKSAELFCISEKKANGAIKVGKIAMTFGEALDAFKKLKGHTRKNLVITDELGNILGITS